MVNYIIERIVYSLIVLIGITLITSMLIFLVPGDPVLSIVGENASPETIRMIKEKLLLDQPFIVQYFAYLKKLFTFITTTISPALPLMLGISWGPPVHLHEWSKTARTGISKRLKALIL